MRFTGIAVICFLLAASGSALADGAAKGFVSTSAAAPVSVANAHHVGDAFDYTIRGSMTQAISGHDPLGQKVQQAGMPTTLDGREHISIKQISGEGITLHRSGLIVAAVSNAKPEKSAGKGWTLVRDDGSIARDTGNLGGVFLLPLPFLGDKSVDAGSELQIGSTWAEKLGTKLFGMTARPMMNFQVTGQHLVLGVDVFDIDAEGTAPMKEPIVSNTGQPLGYATGTAHIAMHGEYDRANHRMISMDIEVSDTLRISGPNKRTRGVVGDHQHYVVALDPASLASAAVPPDATTIEAPVTH